MQRFLAAPQLILCLLAVFDIRACTVPPDDLAGFIPEWLGANEKPAVSSVMPAKACLYLAWFSRNRHRFPFFHQGRQVLWMKHTLPAPATRVFGGETGILMVCFVDELVRAVRQIAPGQRWD